jgi:hypothetical protein
MQLTRAADYGVRVMIHLAGPSTQERISLPALAEAADAPESFLSKVLQALSRAGLISSRRGQSGGFQISARGRVASMPECLPGFRAILYPQGTLPRSSGMGAGANGHAAGAFRGQDRGTGSGEAAIRLRHPLSRARVM